MYETIHVSLSGRFVETLLTSSLTLTRFSYWMCLLKGVPHLLTFCSWSVTQSITRVRQSDPGETQHKTGLTQWDTRVTLE